MPIAYLTRRAVFSASHRLHSAQFTDAENEAMFGKCNSVNGHGHNYTIEVTVRGQIDPGTGLIINLTDLKEIIESEIMVHVDHKHLNHDVPFLEGVNPTAENLVVAFWKRLERRLPQGLLHEVRILETENNFAVYRGE
jgi:6-pyruvoyltetrahydropterin/6-carboxytetrahydropterin synthase